MAALLESIVQVFDCRVNLLSEIGRGHFGTVHLAYDKSDNKIAAKKVSTVIKEDKQKASTEAMKFHTVRGRLECYEQEHIVQIYDVKYFAGAMWIIMEYCDPGDSNKFFGSYENLLEDDTRKIELMRQIAKGLAFLHDRRIVNIACPYEIFKCTKCVKFLFVLVLLDFRKRTKKRFRKSVGNFLRYEFFCI